MSSPHWRVYLQAVEDFTQGASDREVAMGMLFDAASEGIMNVIDLQIDSNRLSLEPEAVCCCDEDYTKCPHAMNPDELEAAKAAINAKAEEIIAAIIKVRYLFTKL